MQHSLWRLSFYFPCLFIVSDTASKFQFIRLSELFRITSVALGPYFEDFIKAQIAQGRYNNASEVIRAGLRMLEDNDTRIAALKSAIEEGMNSGEAVDFDPAAHLKSLKASKRNA